MASPVGRDNLLVTCGSRKITGQLKLGAVKRRSHRDAGAESIPLLAFLESLLDRDAYGFVFIGDGPRGDSSLWHKVAFSFACGLPSCFLSKLSSLCDWLYHCKIQHLIPPQRITYAHRNTELDLILRNAALNSSSSSLLLKNGFANNE
jgi:hypothetical protein